MTVSTRKYRVPHTSEREFGVRNLCRLIVLVAARAHETDGEQLIRGNGRPYSHDDRMTVARWLRRLAARSRGEPPTEAKGFNRAEALDAYRQAFPTGKAWAEDLTPKQMRDYLDAGWFISVSGNTDDVPASSPLDDWVNDVPHEIGVLPYPTDHGPLVEEPMRPKGAGLIRVKWSDLDRFTSEFADSQDRRLCICVRAGRDTQAARVAREQRRTIERVREQRDEALDIVREQKAKLADLYREVDSLTTRLSNCRDDALDRLFDELDDWVEAQRTTE